MKPDPLKIFKTWQRNSQFMKILFSSLLGSIIFLLLIPLFTSDEKPQTFPIPKTWQKMELTVAGMLKVHPGDRVSVYHPQGELLISEAIILALHSQDLSTWKVEIATPPLSALRWRQLSTLGQEILYLTPKLSDHIVRHIPKRMNYEMVY